MSHNLESDRFDPSRLLLEETLYHTANGYVGVRAAFEEGYAPGQPTVRGSYVNAFYDTHPINHPEKLYGFPETGEKIVAVTDAQGIELHVDGERLLLTTDSVERFSRRLDMESGTAEREFVWRGRSGKRIEVRVSRFCSFARPELFAVRCRVRSLDRPLALRLVPTLEGDVANFHDESDPRVSGAFFKPLEVLRVEARPPSGGARSEPERRQPPAGEPGTGGGELYVESRTKETGFHLAVLSLIECSLPARWNAATTATRAQLGIELTLNPDQSVALERRTIFADSIRHGEVSSAARSLADAVRPIGFDALLAEHGERLAEFWSGCELSVDGDPSAEEGLRYGMYQLLQSAPSDGRSSIPAKGLSGEGYEGHYFWDTEVYMAPFFIYTRPRAARQLLLYRHSILDGARAHARDMGQRRGAAFPWRTIAGRECSSYYPSGSAQYHINADIAYACWAYYEATEDFPFLVEGGAELLFETARTWLEIGHLDGGEFRIEAVTGPDEYSCLVDNNFYTNAMARYNLEQAARAWDLLATRAPETLARLRGEIGLEDREPGEWRRAAQCMYLPHDAERDLTPQDDGFLRKAVWDLEGTADTERPLLLHYHHLAIIRRQVCKQADVVLAHFLLPGVSAESTQRNSFSYYERVTTHDSSLSYAIFSAMAARLG
ncbi:MAG TPA: family 65 glycosyl hydrolase, partial [Rectinemataceae bacterium]|nr:family 65 glycosyl hydrolase [Rectinemataceae bacterium]